MSSNIHIQINSVSQATDDMEQLTKQMETAFGELLSGIKELAESGSGQTNSTWKQVQTQLNTAINEMRAQFGSGNVALRNMLATHVRHDGLGAQIVGG